MSRDDHAHLYQAVPVLVWPWLWWQLFRLRLWVAATGRDILCGVDRWGNLRVHLVGDEPGLWTPSVHPHLHQYYLTDELANETRPQWRARIAAVFCEGFGVPDWVIFPRRSGEACGAEGEEVRARIRDPVERKTALSLVHGLAKPDRNPLRIACPKGLARCQTQPSPQGLAGTWASPNPPLSTAEPVQTVEPISPNPPHTVGLEQVMDPTRSCAGVGNGERRSGHWPGAEALRASRAKQVPRQRYALRMNQAQG